MRLRGQHAQAGYAMAALLVGISVMAIVLTVVMPVWHQAAQREKEAELVFRGEQYARAIGLFQRKAGPGTLPPNLDLLVDQRFLRRKYKDPITNDDFVPILLAAATQPGAGQPAPPGRRGGARGGAGAPTGAFSAGRQAGAPPGAASGGIVGVTSKSKAESIRLYKGRNHYNEWQFVFTPPAQAPGAGPGGLRGRGQNPNAPLNPFGAPFGRPGGPGSPNGRGPFPPSGPGNPQGPGNPSAPTNPNAPGNPNSPGRRGGIFIPTPPPPGR